MLHVLYDHAADVLTVRLTEETPARTISLRGTDRVDIGLDADGDIVSLRVELPTRQWPLAKVQARLSKIGPRFALLQQVAQTALEGGFSGQITPTA